MGKHNVPLADMELFCLTVRDIHGNEKDIHGHLLDYDRGVEVEGKHRYSIRHSDYDDSAPATLEKDPVTVNWYGDFFIDEDLEFGPDGTLLVLDWNYD